MIAGVAIDDWKVPIFKQHLDAAGYKYTEGPGLTLATRLLSVTYTQRDMDTLHSVLVAAADECRTQVAGTIQ